MSSYLAKLGVFAIFVSFIISSYYGISFHNEASTGYAAYFITMILVYGMYKGFSLYSGKDKVSFSPLSIGLYTLLHVFILSFAYFGLTGGANGGFVLFFKILGYLFFPLVIVFLTYNLGHTLLKRFVSGWSTEEPAFRFLTSIGLGFVAFFSLLTIAGSIGFYNIWSVLTILAIFLAVGFSEIGASLKAIVAYKFSFPNHRANGTFFEQINLHLLSTEFLFLILTYLIGVSFINIVRPMPIGWDDLGVYMNFPQMMANQGTILKGAGMVAWQAFTGIGFMFHSAPAAFFFNQVGGLLSVIVLALSISSLLKNETGLKGVRSLRTFLNLPLLAATMFYSMPMVIFQQAKDMKLDPGFFFIAAIGIYLVLALFVRYRESTSDFLPPVSDHLPPWGRQENNTTRGEGATIPLLHSMEKGSGDEVSFFHDRKNLILLAISGLIIGLAFTVKFTALMLILGLIATIFYGMLGLSGFLGFGAAFIAVFTKFKLWDYLNVSYPKDDTALIQNVVIGAAILTVAFLSYAWHIHKHRVFKQTLLLVLIFSVGVGAATLPWVVKNVSETGTKNLSIGGLLAGSGGALAIDYGKIYSPEQLKAIESRGVDGAITSSGKSTNEDLGRYFGYEDGVNNYLKLPLNLTNQSNQAGEYTEITYFYLALIPIIFLFLAYQNPAWLIGLIGMLAFEYAYFFNPALSKPITDFFATKDLPGGYAYILALSLLPLVYYSFALAKNRLNELFKLNLAFVTMYVFIFVIAAYGIVWYGISMYFAFLLAIMIGATGITLQDGDAEDKGNIVRFGGSLVFFLLVSIYFFSSAIPHGWNNLKSAGFNEFKSASVNQEEGIFGSHPDYFNILANLNLKPDNTLLNDTLGQIENPTLKQLVQANIGTKPSLKQLESVLREISQTDLSRLGLDPTAIVTIQQEASKLVNSLYQTVLYPPRELQNPGIIYRIGTFLTYFIDHNRARYYDDSLVFSFDKYFYDTNSDTTIERMKKLGFQYFLVDLNAATIDRDPRHDLTRRFENLLKTFKSDKLELVQTDSPCLQIALEEKNPITYMTYAGVNYESYTKDASGIEKAINRGEKQYQCYNHILELIKDGKIDSTHYTYLSNFADYMKKNPPKTQQDLSQAFQNYIGHGWLALFRIK